ncbi:hypothetical protein PR003_g22523 [Phytophthora rubi]|uniref:Uncharacterized protein n=1 Tax=Phytophthora rubi TaxID=129364 RepID=A0A6A4D514_9STRA|nr:hypothetical protein PR003_g22523 [Phytophthora rubi]
MAQYLRDPLIVLDVNRFGDAQVQRYTYKMHGLTNGDDHESGCYEALSGRQARDYLHACWNLHVLPYFMIRNVSERHFYGVMHGERFVRWRAEGDPGYAAKVSDSYEWKQAVNYLAPEEDTDPDSLNKLADLNNVNAVLIKRITMRERLDVVHARQGLPALDAIGYDDEADLEETIAYEERTLHEALGIDQYASGSQTSHDGMSMEVPLPKRYPRASTGEMVEHAYFRLLRAPEGEEIDPDDFAQYRLVTAANMEAFQRWCSLFRPRLQIPSTKRRSNPRHIAAWLLGNIDALRHLFAFLPYPELEAKQWTLADLTKWGRIEVYREQTDAIWRITQDEAIRQDVRDVCTEWHDAISKGPEQTRYALAGDCQRWARLRRVVNMELCRENTTALDDGGWALLHVLPYVTSTWLTTPMGRAPSGARSVWYHEFPCVREFCHSVLDHTDWSASLHFPARLTWADQCADDATGGSTPTRN